MNHTKCWLRLLALAFAVGVFAAVREWRITAIEAEFAAGDRPVG